jgi:uncharacterized membrane protein
MFEKERRFITKDRLISRMSMDAMFMALYFVLAGASFPIGNIRLTLASLPLVFVAVVLGPVDTLVVAALGELLIQVFRYGFSITLPLWLLAPIFRGLIIALVASLFRKKGEMLDHHPWVYYPTVLFASVVATGINTLCLYLGAIIIGYPVSIVWLETLIRFGVGVASAVLVALAVHPLADAIRRFRPSLAPLTRKNNSGR